MNFGTSCKLGLIFFSFLSFCRNPEWFRFLGRHQAFMNHCHSEGLSQEESQPGARLRWPISFRWTSQFDLLATNPSTRRKRKKRAVHQFLLVQHVHGWFVSSCICKSCYLMATLYGGGAKLTTSCFTLQKKQCVCVCVWKRKRERDRDAWWEATSECSRKPLEEGPSAVCWFSFLTPWHTHTHLKGVYKDVRFGGTIKIMLIIVIFFSLSLTDRQKHAHTLTAIAWCLCGLDH